ncbi:hypothetical protein KAF81_32140 [Pseudomonas aeruginosa]|nr:hypothetical protein [Pseudomonas aeruginosa]MBG5800570.1 hypothetical protein [Pseudomonas aeruginosa]MBH3513569.1 hypothetical protein [Pseudomonas aeruginosa]MBH4307117.1 hypothetical protein [Pseudomonas aeruginosa]MBH8775920.1 hypothetical protein [Pseudomonas aeruginosa]
MLTCLDTLAAGIDPAEVLENAPTKMSRVLAYMLMPSRTLNIFEAERIGDHCLRSTISTFANTHGLIFERINERVENNWGTPSDVVRYRLPETQRKAALVLLALLVVKARKSKPLN